MSITGPTTDQGEIRRWAVTNGAVPTEILPQIVDSIPAVLHMMLPEQTRRRADIRIISWDEFFLKFDGLGLAFVYDDAPTGYNEILQVEDRSPFRHPRYRPSTTQHVLACLNGTQTQVFF